MGPIIFLFYVALFGFLTVRHMAYATLALICMFALEQWGAIYIPFVQQNGALVNIAVLSLLIFSWFRLPTGASLEFAVYPIRLLLLLLLLYAFVSTAWAPNDAYAMGHFTGYLHYLVAVTLLGPLFLRQEQDFHRVLDGLVLYGGGLVILLAFVPNFENRAITADGDLDSAVALPLALAEFAGMVAITAIARIRLNLLSIVWALIVAGSAFLLMAKTGSRGQLIFCLIAVPFCLPLRWRQFTVHKFMVYAGLAIMLAGSFLVVKNTENAIAHRMGDGGLSSSVDQRAEMIITLLQKWSESDYTHLIFGLGSSASYSPSVVGFYPHVVPLEILGELGLAGFTLFMLIVTSLTVLAYSSKLRRNLSERSAENFAALYGCWLYMLMISTKQGSFIESTTLMLFTILVEKCARVGQVGMERKRKSSSRKRARARKRQQLQHAPASGQ